MCVSATREKLVQKNATRAGGTQPSDQCRWGGKSGRSPKAPTHTHTHTHGERERRTDENRNRGGEIGKPHPIYTLFCRAVQAIRRLQHAAPPTPVGPTRGEREICGFPIAFTLATVVFPPRASRPRPGSKPAGPDPPPARRPGRRAAPPPRADPARGGRGRFRSPPSPAATVLPPPRMPPPGPPTSKPYAPYLPRAATSALPHGPSSTAVLTNTVRTTAPPPETREFGKVSRRSASLRKSARSAGPGGCRWAHLPVCP